MDIVEKKNDKKSNRPPGMILIISYSRVERIENREEQFS